MGSRGMALAAKPTPGRRPLLRLLSEKRLHQHSQIYPYIEYGNLPQRLQSAKLYHSSIDGQNLAQRAPTEGGHVHLANSQQRPPGRDLAPDDGPTLALQGLRRQQRQIASALPPRVLHGSTRLGRLQTNLVKMAHAL
jgi:hypothetical protein